MKKSYNFKCPNCGASLKINKNSNSVKCEYCGTTLLLKDDQEEKIKSAFVLINQRAYFKARDFLKDILTKDSENGKAYLGLLMCYLEVPTTDLLDKVGFDYSKDTLYQQSVDYLDSPQKEKLIKACQKNLIFIKNKKKDKNKPIHKTKLMQEFEKCNDMGDITLIGVFVNADFKKASDEQVINFYFNNKDKMERMIQIVNELSQEELLKLPSFETNTWNDALYVYSQIKEIIEKLPKDYFEK